MVLGEDLLITSQISTKFKVWVVVITTALQATLRQRGTDTLADVGNLPADGGWIGCIDFPNFNGAVQFIRIGIKIQLPRGSSNIERLVVIEKVWGPFACDESSLC